MNTAETMKRNNQAKRDILKVLNGSRDATFMQKQAAVLQTLSINLSRSSLYRLEMNGGKKIIKAQLISQVGFHTH